MNTTTYKSDPTRFVDTPPSTEGVYVFRGTGRDEGEESLLFVSEIRGQWMAYDYDQPTRKVADMSGYWLVLPDTPNRPLNELLRN